MTEEENNDALRELKKTNNSLNAAQNGWLQSGELCWSQIMKLFLLYYHELRIMKTVLLTQFKKH